MRLTDTEGRDVFYVDRQWIRSHGPDGDMALVIAPNGSTIVLQGSPAEVARLLAGGEGETLDPDLNASILWDQLIACRRAWGEEVAALTAEVERLRSTIGSIGDEGDDIIAALKRERDDLAHAVTDLEEAVRENLPAYAPDNDPDDRLNEIETIEQAGADLDRLERERDEARAASRMNRELAATHQCRECGAKWISFEPGVNTPEGDPATWSLASETCGPCCDNVEMDDQIQPIGWYARMDEARVRLDLMRQDFEDAARAAANERIESTRLRSELARVVPAELPDGWQRKDVKNSPLTGGIVGLRTWFSATDPDIEGAEIEVTADGVMFHGFDAWTEWQPRGIDDVCFVLDAAAARCVEIRKTQAPAPAPEPEEPAPIMSIWPAGEAGDEGAGESGQEPEWDEPDDPEAKQPGTATPAETDPSVLAIEAPLTRPAVDTPPATPTTAREMLAPTSTSGITVTSGTGSFLPLTRKSDGFFLRGCSYVLVMPSDGELRIIGDSSAEDGQAPGTIRYRVNNGSDPFGDDKASSSKAALLKADTVVRGAPTWPEANGPISVADLGPPLTDADGSKWWRVEAWSDVSATANKSEATDRATVFFVCVLAPGVEAPRPPAIGYHASDPIVIGSPVVHPITFVTDADPSPGAGENPSPLLYEEFNEANILRDADPGLKGLALALHRDNFQSKRGGPYAIDRAAGHHLTLRPPNIRQPQYSALCTAVRLLTGEATDEDKRFLRLYALNNGLSAPEIAIGEHGDTTALWGGFSYDAAFEETFSVAVTYSWGRRFNLWTPSEEARIRDQLARFVWTSLQLHRNPYRKWIHANGSTQAMWESARDQVSGLVARVMRGYRSPQYSGSGSWMAYFVDGVSLPGFESRSGLYGLLSDEPRWNASPSYFTSHNCAGPLALTLVCLANAGESVPSYYEDAFLLALDGKLPGAEGVHFWSPLMVNDHFPRLRDAILARHGKAAVLAAAREISLGDPNDPAKPGGMGAGTAVLSLLSIDFGGA